MDREAINQRNEQIIENYKKEEGTMIFIFAQWCVNNDLDPLVLYEQAYPEQVKNEQLQTYYEQTVPKEDAEEISDELLLQVLDLYGNHDLAFVVSEAIHKKEHSAD